VQIIWAGKPYPQDYGAVEIWNNLAHLAKKYPNVAILTGYELDLSKKLKAGSDVWLNNPRVPREASGTSGMTAAMLGSVNVSTFDGWVPEFCKQGKNGWMIPKVDLSLPQHEQDIFDRDNMLDILENEVIPTYYDKPKTWLKIVKQGQKDVTPQFDSNRMATEYYTKLYTKKVVKVAEL
jgi:starch phosphorylase